MRFLTFAALCVMANVSCASTTQEADRPPALNCEIGPLHMTYGQTAWLVYACDDSRSIVVVSDTGNPAMPFYFILYVKPDGSMKLYGEGTGKKSATQPAFDDLKKLTVADISGLVDQANSIGKAQ
jgi:hypothetical protein